MKIGGSRGTRREAISVKKEEPEVPAKNAKAYGLTVHLRIFAEGQLVLRAAEHVRKNIPRPSKFAPKWEGPYIIREAHDNGYYYLAKEVGTSLIDPINAKWLKQ